jgi:hypothetical protein
VNLKLVFRSIQPRTLAVALTGADNETKERVVASLARRPMNEYVSLQLTAEETTPELVAGARAAVETEMRRILTL